MRVLNLREAQANLDLVLLDAEANSIARSDLYLWLRKSGLPSEVVIRLNNFVDTTIEIANFIISIGKIVLIKIIEFVRAHPNLATGIAVGAAVGALVSMIPFLGPYLGTVAMALGVTLGAIVGYRRDKLDKGESADLDIYNPISITQDLIEIAKEFFKLLIDVFNLVFDGQDFNRVS